MVEGGTKGRHGEDGDGREPPLRFLRPTMALSELRSHRRFLRRRDTGRVEAVAPAVVRVQCAQNRDF
jgi:hypothetical protein